MAEMDLNLLRVFDTLVELRSVTRAANRLGLTQSAISHALGRLRHAIGDPLFVRGPHGLQPTARAVEIAPGIREGLLQLRGALSPSLFDPASAVRRFTLSAGSYFCTLLVPDLIARARALAPGVSFTIVAPGVELLAALDEGTIDLALGAFRQVPARLTCEPLYREDLVWIAAADHPIVRHPEAASRIGREQRLEIAARRSVARPGSYVSEGGLERRVTAASSHGDRGEAGLDGDACVTVYDAVTATTIVGQSDLVALIPRRFALRVAAARGLAIIEPVEDHGGMDMAMLWHGKLDADAGLAWLRGLIREALDAAG